MHRGVSVRRRQIHGQKLEHRQRLRHDAFEIVVDDVDSVGFTVAIAANDFAGNDGGIGISRLRQNVECIRR